MSLLQGDELSVQRQVILPLLEDAKAEATAQLLFSQDETFPLRSSQHTYGGHIVNCVLLTQAEVSAGVAFTTQGLS